MKSFYTGAILILFVSFSLNAQVSPIFTPSDAIIGGELQPTEFVEGVAGTLQSTNNWPNPENPSDAINGVGQKHLNFIRENAGFIVTPAGGASVANQMQLWTANDVEARDPASYEIYGTNSAIGSSPFPLTNFTLISSGSLSLPASRNPGGLNVLDVMNSQTLSFANTTSYTSYMIVFPTVKDPTNANSMQIAEVQLFGNVNPSAAVPTLSQWGMIILGLLMAIFAVSFSIKRSTKFQAVKQ